MSDEMNDDGHDWERVLHQYADGSLTVFICSKCRALKTAHNKPCAKRNKP